MSFSLIMLSGIVFSFLSSIIFQSKYVLPQGQSHAGTFHNSHPHCSKQLVLLQKYVPQHLTHISIAYTSSSLGNRPISNLALEICQWLFQGRIPCQQPSNPTPHQAALALSQGQSPIGPPHLPLLHHATEPLLLYCTDCTARLHRGRKSQ